MTRRQEYKANIWKVYVFKFLREFTLFSGVLIPFFMVWGGISFFQVMILQAFFMFSMFLLEVPTGAVADYFGRKISLILAGFVTAIAVLVYSSYPSFGVFMLGEFLWAVGTTLISGADQAMVYDSLKEIKKEKESKKIFGRLHSAGLLAIMLSAPLGSIIAQYFGLRFTMMFMFIPMLSAGAVAFTLKEPEFKKRHKKEKYLQTLKQGIKYLKGHKILRILTFDYISISVLAFLLVWVYQLVLQNLKVPIVYFGFVLSIMLLLEIAISTNFTRFEKLFRGKRRYIIFSAIITGVGFILMTLSLFLLNVYIALLGILLTAGFGLTRRPLFKNYMNKFIESHHRATVLSAITMFYSISLALGYLLFGYFVDLNLKYTLLGVGFLVILFTIVSRVKEEHLLD